MRLPTILTSDELTIYLNDHLAGSTVGVELAERTLGANRTTEFGPGLEELAAEIEEDRRTLERIFNRLGFPRDRAKLAFAWLGEKVGRAKLNGRLFGYSPLSRLVELEGLSAGVHAKLNLWRSLTTIAASDSRFDEVELEALVARAESQLERLAALRVRAAELALRP